MLVGVIEDVGAGGVVFVSLPECAPRVAVDGVVELLPVSRAAGLLGVGI